MASQRSALHHCTGQPNVHTVEEDSERSRGRAFGRPVMAPAARVANQPSESRLSGAGSLHSGTTRLLCGRWLVTGCDAEGCHHDLKEEKGWDGLGVHPGSRVTLTALSMLRQGMQSSISLCIYQRDHCPHAPLAFPGQPGSTLVGSCLGNQ